MNKKRLAPWLEVPVRTLRLFSTMLVLFAFLLVVAPAPVARAATITVNTNSGGTGGPDCTLRDAITAANTDTARGGCPAGSGADIISLPAGVTITLTVVDSGSGRATNGLPPIMSDITINGNNAIIERSNAGGTPYFRIVSIGSAGTLLLNNVTIRNGRAGDGAPGQVGGNGGGIEVAGTLTLNNSTVSGNRAGDGDAGGWGGGIYISSLGSANIGNSTISSNTAGNGSTGVGGNGGGIANENTLYLTSSTISGNTAGNGGTADGSNGGGIFNSSSGSATVTNSTINGNTTGTPSGAGGGIFSGGKLSVISSTIASNTATGQGGGIRTTGGTATLRNTIVANNTASTYANCLANITNGGNNLDSGTSCSWGSANGSLSNTNPLLVALANYGGSTQTMALLPGSPAIDGVTYNAPNSSPATDQRGVARPQGAAHDIGAYESRGFTLTKTAGDSQSATINTAFATLLAVTLSETGGSALPGATVTFTAPGSGASGTFANGTATTTATTNGSGVATATTFTANGEAGAYNVAASVTGSGAPATFALTNTKGNTTTLLGSSANPSIVGQAVTFTATVSAVTTGTPTGNVTFKDTGTAICSNVALTGGQATCTASTLTTGTHTITAEYSGDSNFNASTGALSPDQTVGNANLFLPLILR
jgi:hypothetical protein